MEKALLATQLLFYLLGGLGMFFLGVGSLWLASIYKTVIDKNESRLN